MTVPEYLNHITAEVDDLPTKPFYRCEDCGTNVYNLFEADVRFGKVCYPCHQWYMYRTYRDENSWRDAFDWWDFCD